MLFEKVLKAKLFLKGRITMKIDVRFLIFPRGTPIPADHGFPIYSAISRILPEWHEMEDFGIFPIAGIQIGNRMMALTETSRLSIRIDAERIGEILSLAGKSIGLGSTFLQIGVPTVHSLVPAGSLRCRLATIKGFMEPDEFIGAVRRQLDALGISPSVLIETGKTRDLMIHDKRVVGFELFLYGLNEEESIRVQENGIGGRRKMGCGLFLPTQRKPHSNTESSGG